MKTVAAFAVLTLACADEDSMMLQHKLALEDAEVLPKKSVARLTTEMWCYKFCGRDGDCSLTRRASAGGQKVQMCEDYCEASDVEGQEGRCGRNQQRDLVDKLCENGSQNARERSNYHKVLGGYCRGACAGDSAGVCQLKDKQHLQDVTDNSVGDGDVCADYCTAKDNGVCVVSVTEDGLCETVYSVDLDDLNPCRAARVEAEPIRTRIKTAIGAKIAEGRGSANANMFCNLASKCPLHDLADDRKWFITALCGETDEAEDPAVCVQAQAIVQARVADRRTAMAGLIAQNRDALTAGVDMVRLCEAGRRCKESGQGTRLAEEMPLRFNLMQALCGNDTV